MKELIPYIEGHFRTIGRPEARLLVGKSTGGRDALTLQVFHPNEFGGAWIFYPSAFDLHRFFGVDIYNDVNLFYGNPDSQFASGGFVPPWSRFERPFPLSLEGQPLNTLRGWAHYEHAVGGATTVNEELAGTWNAAYSPVGPDGYPRPFYDLNTGLIDKSLVEYWRQHADIADYIRRNWPRIGPSLAGKLHFAVGDSDEWYRQYGVYDLDAFFSTATPAAHATFTYGPHRGHMWQPETNAALIREIADFVVAHSPPNADNRWREGN
jgi:hypothetical protein